MRTAIRLRGDILFVHDQRYDLRRFKNIFVIGAGKATLGMAQTLHQLLGNRITAGYINVPTAVGTGLDLSLLRQRIAPIIVNYASHPFPNAAGVRGAKKILQLAQQATADDLVICLISGGASSLLPLPIPGVTLAKKIAITKKLLRSGATINEINTVRKRLSAIKGGKLALAAQPATVLGLIISDVIGDELDIIGSGPTVLDTTISTILPHPLTPSPGGRRGEILDLFPSPTRRGIKGEVVNVLIGSNQQALQSLQQQARRLGIRSMIITSQLQGEAREVSKVLMSIAREVKLHHQPVRPPVLLLAGGETTVTVTGQGSGGRNQELALATLPHMIEGVTLMSLATDGVDGFTPRPVAGAIADLQLQQTCQQKKIPIETYLRNNDAYTCLKKLDALFFTGPTGTNVGDIIMILVK